MLNCQNHASVTEYSCTARSVQLVWHTGFTPFLIHVLAKSCFRNSWYNVLNVMLTSITNYIFKKKKKKKHHKDFYFILDQGVKCVSYNRVSQSWSLDHHQHYTFYLCVAYLILHLMSWFMGVVLSEVKNMKCWGCSRIRIGRHFSNLLCNVCPFKCLLTARAAKQLLTVNQIPSSYLWSLLSRF